MIRDIDEKLISPERLMSSSDMARVGCSGCAGCSECCRDRAGAIVLDRWDVRTLKGGLGKSFEELLDSRLIELTLVDGILLPALGRRETPSGVRECVFLNSEGRCGIHEYRPGICRMFPLARLYHEDGSFSYFLQEGECAHPSGVKIKISRWLEVGNIKAYEQEVRDYHDDLKALRSAVSGVASREQEVALQKDFLSKNFL